MIEWLRRVLHLGPDHDTIERANQQVADTYRSIRHLEKEQAALGEELARLPRDPLAQALLTARGHDQPARAIREAHRLLEGGR